jgi:hypothetical protein
VVNAALGRRVDIQDRPDESVLIDFPLAGGPPVEATVVAWRPLEALGHGDVALLQITKGLIGVLRVPMVPRAPAANDELRVFGFPANYPDGMWKSGLSYAGPMVGRWSQINGDGVRGVKLQSGFSGCPVFEASDRAVGVFAQADPKVDIGAYIPTSILDSELAVTGGDHVLPIETSSEAGIELADATTVFVGRTERGPRHGVLSTSWDEFREVFGEPLPPQESYLGVAVRGFFQNGGRAAYIIRVMSPSSTAASVRIPTRNPGQNLIVTARTDGSWANGLNVTIEEGARQGVRLSISKGIADEDCTISRLDYSQLIEDYDNLSWEPGRANQILERVTSRYVALDWSDPSKVAQPLYGNWWLAGGSDGAASADDFIGSRVGPNGIGAIYGFNDVGLACIPDADHPTLSDIEREKLIHALVETCEQIHCVALLGFRPGVREIGRLRPPVDSRAAAIFFPAIEVVWPGTADCVVTPVGHIAGAIARNDYSRGVHTSPIGTALRGAASPDFALAAESVTALEAALLFRRGVNLLRADANNQPVITAAQSASIDDDWRPLHVVRTALMIERAVLSGLAWTSFAPNNAATWTRVREEIETYFARLWQYGVLLGGTTDEAFFVRCDSSTMTRHDIENGRLVAEIGLVFADSELRPPSTITLKARPSV